MNELQQEILESASYRLSPAHLANQLTRGRYKLYPHIEYLNRIIAPALLHGGARLIVSVPPRHGKSWLISKYTPAWYLSLFPKRNVLLASYEASFAASWGRQARNFIQEHSKELEISLSQDSQAADRWNTNEGGGMITAGVGGAITGRGGDCFVGTTRVLTSIGWMPISEIHESTIKPLVLSYDHRSQTSRWSRVRATRKKFARPSIRITTADGRTIQCTSDHRIFSGKTYRASSSLTSGDGLLLLPKNLYQAEIRVPEAATQRAQRQLLLKAMLSGSSRNQEPQEVRSLPKASTQENKTVLPRMQAVGFEISAGRSPISALQSDFSPAVASYSVLRKQLRRQSAFEKNAWEKEFKLQTRKELSENLSEAKAFDQRARQGLSDLSFGSRTAGSSRGSRQAQQYGFEPGNALQLLPYHPPQVTSGPISSVERLSTPEVPVYDLDVENDHNFFAEGILVHNCLIIDDPVKNWEEASSETYLQRTIDWWQSTFYTRAEPNASIIILATRWSQRDLSGYLLSDENENHKDWTEIRLPALAEQADPLGRMPGEALCPTRFDNAALIDIRRAIGSRAWNALYQQRPSAEEGNLIKRQWFKFYVEPPKKFDELIISVDATFTGKSTSDYVAMGVWGRIKSQKYWMDLVYDRMGITETIKALYALSRKWPEAALKLVENKANGPAIEDLLKKELSGIVLWEPKGDKVSRVNAVAPQFESGSVFFPHPSIAPWISSAIEEIVTFPNAQHDDRTDQLTQALIRLEDSANQQVGVMRVIRV